MKEIRQIIASYDRFKASGLKMALASVVQIEESSYRRIGARMLVCANGEWSGGISGGCLEGDALRRSQKAIQDGKSTTVIYDTMEDDQNQIGVGLGCNGKIEVLFSPINPKDSDNEVEKLRSVVQKNNPAILLKLISSSEGKEIGNTKLIDLENRDASFAGLSDTQVHKAIEEVRINRRPQILHFKDAHSGAVEILVEYLRPETRLVILGDNYDVLAMAGLANEIGWELHVVGRKRKISKAIYAKCNKLYEYEHIEQVPITEFTAVVLMTHDYNWDKKLLPIVLSKNPAYVGMLGPKKRVLKINEELEGLDLKSISIFHSPVGLDIGAETPEEIAVSIAAEIIAVMRNRKGEKLKFREGTIHNRKTKIHVAG
jgi:xanthine/CO dehydrogenase XdhC/CoxF family maturation factor